MVAKEAWVSVSLDPTILGVGQKLKKFYTRVQQKFMCLFDDYVLRPEDVGDKSHNGRTPPQIENRFQKVMKVEVVIFNKYFKEIRAEKPSGTPLSEYMRLACIRYNNREKDPFKFIHCEKTLQKVPKYNPMMNISEDPIDIDQNPVANQATEGIMGSNLARPQGRKSAKSDEAAKKRTEKKRKTYVTSATEVIDIDAEVEATKLIAESIAMLSTTIASNSFFDKWKDLSGCIKMQE